MSTLFIRGRQIDVAAKNTKQRLEYLRRYEGYSDERLDQLHEECMQSRQLLIDQQAKRKASRRRTL